MISSRSLKMLIFTGYFVGVTVFIVGAFGLATSAGLTVLGLTLMMSPGMVFALGERRTIPENLALGSLLFPLVVMNYLYTLKMGYPVGFQDVHSHINEAERLLTANGFIDFDRAQTVSF